MWLSATVCYVREEPGMAMEMLIERWEGQKTSLVFTEIWHVGGKYGDRGEKEMAALQCPCLGESQGYGSLVGCVHQESHRVGHNYSDLATNILSDSQIQ